MRQLVFFLLGAFLIVCNTSFAFDPYGIANDDGVSVNVQDDVVSMSATAPTKSNRESYDFLELSNSLNFSIGYHLDTPLATAGLKSSTRQIQFGFANNNKGWENFVMPSDHTQPAEGFEQFSFLSITAGVNLLENGQVEKYWGVANGMSLEVSYPVPDEGCQLGLSCSSWVYDYYNFGKIETSGTARSTNDGIFYSSYSASTDKITLAAAEKLEDGSLTDKKTLAVLDFGSSYTNLFVGAYENSGYEPNAAPEPVTSLLFAAGAIPLGMRLLQKRRKT